LFSEFFGEKNLNNHNIGPKLFFGPKVVSLAHVAVGLKVFLHTDDKDVFSGLMGRYLFFKEKSVFGDGTTLTNHSKNF
jgi:hypothetical protein